MSCLLLTKDRQQHRASVRATRAYKYITQDLAIKLLYSHRLLSYSRQQPATEGEEGHAINWAPWHLSVASCSNA